MQRMIHTFRQSYIVIIILVTVGITPAAAIAADQSATASSTTDSSQQLPAAETPSTPSTQPAPADQTTTGAQSQTSQTGTATGAATPATLSSDPTSTGPATDTGTASSATTPATDKPAATTLAQPANSSTPSSTDPSAKLNTTTNGTLANTIDTSATSGNAASKENTTVGNTVSGNATDIANVINLLQSQAALAGNGAPVYTANIQGNVTGDFVIDPAVLANLSPTQPDTQPKLTVNSSSTGSINNNINLNAASGSADAVRNTTAGNVVTGNANAVANVVNMINSSVAAGQSFFGVINIYGDLAGNILMPAGSLDSLLGSTGQLQTESTAPATQATTNQQIANNIGLSATSGTVTADQNTTAGNARSGNTQTNLTILNLTGRNVVAANSLLVFVNVLGSWVGLIMDAPAGAASAALGGGVSADSPVGLPADTTIATADTAGITNNINVGARSGDATARQNTTVGNIVSGAATASANVANIIGSHLSLSNWFGVLFINVFGSWHGNFGVAQPTPTAPTPGSTDGGSGQAPAAGNLVSYNPAPTSTGTTGNPGRTTSESTAADSTSTTTTTQPDQSEVLAAHTRNHAIFPPTFQTTAKKGVNWHAVIIGLALAGFTYIGVDRVRTNLRTRQLLRRRV